IGRPFLEPNRETVRFASRPPYGAGMKPAAWTSAFRMSGRPPVRDPSTARGRALAVLDTLACTRTGVPCLGVLHDRLLHDDQTISDDAVRITTTALETTLAHIHLLVRLA